jgi:hypothetical protein
LEDLFLLVFSVVFAFGGLALAGWLAVSGQSTTFDGLFLTFVALVLSLVFLLNASWSWRGQELRQWKKNRSPLEENSNAKIQAKSYPSEDKKTA